VTKPGIQGLCDQAGDTRRPRAVPPIRHRGEMTHSTVLRVRQDFKIQVRLGSELQYDRRDSTVRGYGYR
jgi:hypothetical protein